MLALAPLFAVLGGSIMLELAVPILSALVAVPGQIDQQAAMAFFLVGAVHVALMFLALKVSTTMVSGWQVFGLVPSKERERDRDREGPRPVSAVQPVGAAPRNHNVAPASPGMTPRRVDLAPAQTVVVANDTGPEGSVPRETRVYATSGDGGGSAGSVGPATSRTRGIGNRFRSVPSPTSAPPAPPTKTPPPPETYQ
jgi:type IV secretion system protein VirB6